MDSLKSILDVLDSAFPVSQVPILERTPCANAEPVNQWNCPNNGTLLCGKCRLVGYCSKACQVKHWSDHKLSCKDAIRSPDWCPGWVIENRKPTFMTSGSSAVDENWANNMKDEPLSIGMHLWGNMPAMDILKLPQNEGNQSQDFSLAFIASGDLRHIILTVNDLPTDYTGKLTFLVNDCEHMVVLRNIILLLILGDVECSVARRADIALHFLYSSFIPMEYCGRTQGITARFLEQVNEEGKFSISLSRSTLSGEVNLEVLTTLLSITHTSHDVESVTTELRRVRFAASRKDRHDRTYCCVEPSHRLAFEEFRRFGLVLPFGARNDHFNTPNPFLFSPDGKWLQNDLCSPLKSWNIPSVVKAGRAHGAQREDLYGCLYFFLSDQLRKFAEQLERLQIDFRIFSLDADRLCKELRSGALESFGLPSSMRFDRIDVSNIIDFNYLGIPGVVDNWGPFLANSQHAALVGYFMNWVTRQDGANAQSAGADATAKMVEKLVKAGKLPSFSLSDAESPVSLKRKAGILTGMMGLLNVVYDNSKPFEEYLTKHGLNKSLEKGSLKRRQNHTIVPYRLGAPLGAPPDALPSFPDDENWYLNTCVGGGLYSERFIEIVRR